jgi:hypothetical protein
MIDDPQYVCRSLGYFLQYLSIVAPLVVVAWVTRRIAR